MEWNNIIIICVILAAVLAGIILFLKFQKGKEKGRYVAPKGEKLHVSLESKDLKKTALQVMEGLGGKDNVRAVNFEGSRLKVEIVQYSAVNEAKLRESGVGGVIRPSKTMVHIIVGEKAEALKKELDTELQG